MAGLFHGMPLQDSQLGFAVAFDGIEVTWCKVATMTEDEWLGCTVPIRMLEFLRGKVSDRKLRLFACACYRRCLHKMTEQVQTAVEIAERNADGLASGKEPSAARRAGRHDPGLVAILAAARPAAWHAAWMASGTGIDFDDYEGDPEIGVRAGLLRCVFGNPFRPPQPVPPVILAWNDETVARIAQGVYDDRAFDRLLILADALLDAGCDDEELLAHCRSEGPHVKGCWAVDLLLDKE